MDILVDWKNNVRKNIAKQDKLGEILFWLLARLRFVHNQLFHFYNIYWIM